MKLPLPPAIDLSPAFASFLTEIDQFRSEWRGTSGIAPERLHSLRRLATIESVGSSTRIEGAKLSDSEVEKLLENLQTESFRSRDEAEVAGYARVMEMVQSAWEDLRMSEPILLQLHRDLLQFSLKDERHRGTWKTLPNNVAAFDADGRELGIVFATASPFETPLLMEELIQWYVGEERSASIHPLLRIAVFHVVFLAIHPFQDGNGRLARVLTNLQLLRSGYGFASFASLESVIEHRKEAYYLALRRSQGSFAGEAVDWESWVSFFLRAMLIQIERLRDRLRTLMNQSALPEELSPLAGRILHLLSRQETLTVAEVVSVLGASRNTIKDKFTELVDKGHVTLHGKGRGAHYRPTQR